MVLVATARAVLCPSDLTLMSAPVSTYARVPARATKCPRCSPRTGPSVNHMLQGLDGNMAFRRRMTGRSLSGTSSIASTPMSLPRASRARSYQEALDLVRPCVPVAVPDHANWR